MSPVDGGGRRPRLIDAGRLATLGEFDAIDPGTVRGLVARFAHEAPQRLAWLRAAVDDGDLARLEFHAHALRGSAANLGAAVVAAELAVIESDAREQRQPAPATLTAVEALLERSIAELQRLTW